MTARCHDEEFSDYEPPVSPEESEILLGGLGEDMENGAGAISDSDNEDPERLRLEKDDVVMRKLADPRLPS